MAQVGDATPGEHPARSGRGIKFWIIIVALPIMIAALAGVGCWYFLLRERVVASNEHSPEPELPLPYYLEIKPFVVSMVNSAGAPHFVQLGLNLTVSGSSAGNAITAMLPEIQDAIRQTALGFKVDDIVTPVGVDKLRAAMIANANQAVLRRLGAERTKRLGGADADAGVVQNIYFSTLIVE